jgi:integrase
LAASTLEDYRRDILRLILPSLGNTALADLNPSMVQRWQDALAPTRDSPGATVAARAFRTLRSALSDAERLGLIARNPCKAARPALRSRNRREGFTLQEANAILAAAEGEWLAPLFAFILHSGLRVAEALGLRWVDVNLETGTVSVRRNLVQVGGRMVEGRPKTERSARTFVLPPQALEDLERQKAQQAEERLRAGEAWRDTGRVFTAVNGAPLTTANVDRAFCRVRERAGVRPLPLYSLRHATASILLARACPWPSPPR